MPEHVTPDGVRYSVTEPRGGGTGRVVVKLTDRVAPGTNAPVLGVGNSMDEALSKALLKPFDNATLVSK